MLLTIQRIISQVAAIATSSSYKKCSGQASNKPSENIILANYNAIAYE
jgi:hypothetical protein